MKVLRRYVVVVIILLTASLGHGQSPIFPIEKSNIEIGENVITGQKLEGQKLGFGENIYKVHLDSTHTYITLQLRPLTNNEKFLKNKGNVIQYDADRHFVKWNREVNYGQSLIQHYDQTIIETKPAKSICVDLESGLDKWEIKNNIIYSFPKLKFALGYKAKKLGENLLDLEGIDLTTGQVMWTREIDRHFGWREFVPLDSINILISASGLHMVNWQTGKGWSFKEKAGKRKYNFWTDINTIYNLASNVLVDSTGIYYASNKEILHFDMDGNVLWQSPLPEKETSKSVISFYKDAVVMVNLGMANTTNNPQKKYGTPYIARFDKESGKKQFLVSYQEESEWVNTAVIDEEEIFLGFRHGVGLFNLENGKKMGYIKLDKDVYGDIQIILKDIIYEKTPDEKFLNVCHQDTTARFFYGSKDVIVGIDKKMRIIKTLKWDEIYIQNIVYNDLLFVTRKNDTYVLNEDDLTLFKLNISNRASILGKTLYDIQSDHLISVDISQIVE